MAWIKRLGYLVVLLASLYGVYSFFGAKAGSSASGGMPPTPVGTAKVKKTTWQPTYTTFGNVKAIEGLVLTPEVSGRVSELTATSGQDIEKGDVILKINPSILEGDLANAKAAAELAKIKFERYQKLYEKKAVSSMEFDSYRLAYEQARASAESLQAQLDQHILKAPFSGKLGLTQVQVGSFVTAGTTSIVSLQKLSPIWVDLTIPQKLMGRLQKGQKAILTINANSDESWEADILAIDPNVNASTRRINVRLITDNNEHELKPGAFVTATLPLDEAIDAMEVPLLAIETEPSGTYVYVLEQTKVTKTKVTLGQQFAKSILITSGLKEGQSVITDGRLKIHPGSQAIDINTLAKKEPAS